MRWSASWRDLTTPLRRGGPGRGEEEREAPRNDLCSEARPLDVPANDFLFEAQRPSDPESGQLALLTKSVHDRGAHAEARGDHLRCHQAVMRTRIRRQLAHHRRTTRCRTRCVLCQRVRIRGILGSRNFRRLPLNTTAAEAIDFRVPPFGTRGVAARVVGKMKMAHSSGWETTNQSPWRATTGGTRRGKSYQEAEVGA